MKWPIVFRVPTDGAGAHDRKKCQSIAPAKIRHTAIIPLKIAATRTTEVLCSSPVELLAHKKRRRSAADRFPNGLAYDVDDETRRSDDWRVVYWMRPHPGVHPLRSALKTMRVLKKSRPHQGQTVDPVTLGSTRDRIELTEGEIL